MPGNERAQSLVAYATGAPAPLWWPLLTAPLSWLYRGAVALRYKLYAWRLLKTHRLPGTVLSVGNLAAGGTGKSPVTAALAQLLLARGARPAILTRGYGSTLAKGDSLVLLGGTLAMPPVATATWPDEARMQSVLLPSVPVVVGRDRVAAAKRFLAARPELAPTHWLLDDGFQHRRLHRDADVVLVDARTPFGNGHLLPRGLLREPPAALSRARVVVFTRCQDDAPSEASVLAVRRAFQGPLLKAELVSRRPEQSIDSAQVFALDAHTPALAVTGIAQPQSFLRELTGRHGVTLAGQLVLPDHSVIERSRVLRQLAGARSIITTAKDYWRDPAVFADLPVPVFIAPLSLVWDEAELCRALARFGFA